jgi:hypothetical protein
MKYVAAGLLLLAAGIPSQAQPFRRAWHYVSTHKELLAADAVIIAAWSADAASTVNVQHDCPTCVESSFLVGSHPSAHALWLTAAAFSGGEVTLNHLLWHRAPEPVDRHLIWVPALMVGVLETENVHGNAHTAQTE